MGFDRTKNSIGKTFKLLSDRKSRMLWLASRGYYNHLSDEEYLRKLFKVSVGYPLDLKNPKTFNEKLQWLKLYDHNSKYTMLVDKFAVKEYVASVIGSQYVIPTLGLWDRFDDIDFSILPNQFVLKCTHDSGGLVIVKNKDQMNIKDIKKKINHSMRRNYYYLGREWPYKDVRPRILAEKYMEEKTSGELRDYKFFCFNGIPKCYKIDFNRFIDHHANYFDINDNIMEFGETVCPPDLNKKLEIPATINEMKDLATKLSQSQCFLRTDFYDIDGKVFFGELTFFPDSGFGRFVYEGNDKLFGQWIQLPERVSK